MEGRIWVSGGVVIDALQAVIWSRKHQRLTAKSLGVL